MARRRLTSGRHRIGPRGTLQTLFPRLRNEFAITSKPTLSYNCKAWAAGDTTRWWWPTVDKHWPANLPMNNSLDTFEQLFGQLGYERCENGDLENGFEKIAIYGTPNECVHAARQLVDGNWTSKCGKLEDITHKLECLTGDINDRVGARPYRGVQRFMKRRRPVP